ncbi:hypothetical protein SJAG_03446 [Schizosaccharomyces japonicus yFS275]|uniref:Sorting nexin C-terminal domain-containing protein n=1 Tax=Schizosaccharomyces japonicus (strain yFS275 / FY16936) TaxID=402676 RepID=B6K493_SCHJY|nr:hypothetical protein SJAG_03446 [Schizosaccharomyces japonicus yFS275]EEB08300.2 hypothetical protein SJAG_03446 [Schizosaccharomyces japonicus yFS275]
MSAALADCSFMRQFLSKNMRIRANKVNKKADYVTNLGPVSKRSSELNPYHTEFGNGSSDDENISDYESATEEIPSAYPITEDEKLTECSFQGSGYSSEQEEVKSENYISDRHTRWIIEQAFSLLEGFFALTYKSWTLRRSILQLIRSILQRSTTRMDTIKLKINQFCNTFLTGEYLAEKLNDLYLQLESPNTNYVPLYGKKEEILILLKECLVPDMLQSIVGSTSSSKAVEIVFTALQDEDLMQGIFIHWFAGMLEIINRKARRCKV